MSRNRKLPVQVAFQFFKNYGISHLSEFEQVKLRSCQKDYSANLRLEGESKFDNKFWGELCDEVSVLSSLWGDVLKIKFRIKKDLTSAILTIKAKP